MAHLQVRPTIFFVKEEGVLKQILNADVETERGG